MTSSLILSIVTFTFGFSAVFYIAGLIFKKDNPAILGRFLVYAAIIGCTAGIILRWIESYEMGYGHAPLSNLYESLVFFAWTIAVIQVFVEKKFNSNTIGAFTVPLAFLAIAYASFSPDISSKIQPLLPALKSNWLIAHVFACFLGYAAFTIAFAISIVYLTKCNKQDKEEDIEGILARLPDLETLNELTHQMIMFGFLFLTVGIITGAIWANSAWGTYWSWDPKETWSLITWFVYAIALHARLVMGWDGKTIAFISLIGFVAVMFTYFGVNYLPGLHSYGAK